MTEPKISVVIPALNEEKYLPICLGALQKQTFPKEETEIIVVDSGSTDNTVAVAKSFGAHVVSQTEIRGVGAARQKGFSSARGAIIASTDADSIVPPDWLEKIAGLMIDPDVVLVSGIDRPTEGGPFLHLGFYLYHLFIKTNYFFGKPLPWGNNFAIRQAAFQKTGGFDPNMKTSEDWYLALRAKEVMGRGAKFLYLKSLPVKISTRKYQQQGIFLKYFRDGIYNYWNVVILGRAKSTAMMNIR